MAKICVIEKTHYKPLSYFLANFKIKSATKIVRSESFWYSRFDLWWENNPAFNEGEVRGLILENNGKIVGFIGCIPSYFQLSGEQIIVYNETTWRVDKKFRGIDSINMVLKLLDYTKESLHFRAGGRADARAMQAWLGFENIYPKEQIRLYYVILDLWNIILYKFPSVAINKYYKSLFHPIIILYQLIIKVLMNITSSNYEVRIINNADNSFDELWKVTRTHVNNTNVRTSEVLNWYCSHKGTTNNIIFGCYQGNKLLGYLLCTCEDGDNILKRITVVDFWGYMDDNQIVNSLLKGLLKYGSENNYDLVNLPAFHKSIKKFCNKYIIHRSGMLMEYKAKKDISDKITKDSSFFSYLHGDIGLF